MNLYVRYFSHEILATNMGEVTSFLTSINEINLDQAAFARIQTFWDSASVYPFRLKVSFSNYVLFLKTDAKDLAEFKYLEQQNKAIAKPHHADNGDNHANNAHQASHNVQKGNKANNDNHASKGDQPTPMSEKKRLLELLNEPQEGWYEASLTFKRVVLKRDTSKFQYRDTPFKVRLKAKSAMDCYNRIVEHLRNRQDVDQRSQFPSARSNNFEYRFIGN